MKYSSRNNRTIEILTVKKDINILVIANKE